MPQRPPPLAAVTTLLMLEHEASLRLDASAQAIKPPPYTPPVFRTKSQPSATKRLFTILS